jgi:dephospho-CoA kinase
MLKVGLTGGIGSGKSTVGAIFRSLGIPLFIADLRAHALMMSDEGVKEKIRSLLGNKAFDNQDKPDRKYIASQVFHDRNLLRELNAIIHPAVRSDFDHWCQAFVTRPYVLQEAAVLFESGGAKLMDENIVVWAPEEIRMNRVVLRDHISEKEVRARMQHQWNDLERAAQAQFTVINDNVHSLIRQVKDIHMALCHIDANHTL